MKKPVMLLILDGFGCRAEAEGNAIAAANTPQLDRLYAAYPHTTLGASGMDVGLPDGQMGNSEVGHTNIGAGRIVYQELTRISKTIADGKLGENTVLTDAMAGVKTSGTLHIMGLLSDGGVHSHIDHILALLRLAKAQGVKNTVVHAFLDGRDTDPKSGAGYLRALLSAIEAAQYGSLATITGRYYAMDRDQRWERVELGYRAIAEGKGNVTAQPLAAVEASYANGLTDEFMQPIVAAGYAGVADGDAIIFANFRPDRARELTRVLVDPNFEGFERVRHPLSAYVCMTQYDVTMPHCTVAFAPQSLANTLGEVVEAAGKTQLRIAETEKYAHVTFFFNGGVEAPTLHEARALIPSPKVATYDLQPEMSAPAVTARLLELLQTDCPDLVVLNFANCDMVGHTGVFSAAVQAVETVDRCVGEIAEAVISMGGVILLTADHGNADVMQNPDGSPMTAHSTNPVPLIGIGVEEKFREGGILSDLAPTLLSLLEIPQPAEMTGHSLFA